MSKRAFLKDIYINACARKTLYKPYVMNEVQRKEVLHVLNNI